MRAKEFLLEYDRSREQQRIKQLPAYAQRFKQDPTFSLERLESADPTDENQKIYVPRLAQWWLAGEPVEDLISTTADALEKYHRLKIKKKLKPEHADIGRFKKANDFLAVMKTYVLPGDQAPQDRGQYRQIYQDNEIRVIELLDITAAKFWGQATEWCTAAKNNNRYSYYANKGPLYVIIDRNRFVEYEGQKHQVKYQLHWERKHHYEDWQFKDVHDDEFNPHELPFYAKLQRIFEPLHDHIMWKPNPNEQVQMRAVEQSGLAIQFIENPSERVQLAAVKRDGWALQYIKEPSETIQLAAVSKYGWAIRYIENPSEAVQLAAVKRDRGYAIAYIKNPSEAVQLAAVNEHPYSISYIANPSEAVQLAAVQQNGYAIEFIKNPSEAVQLAAVKRNGWLIQFIKNPSEAVQLAAVQQAAQAIKYIKNPTPRVQALAKELNSAK